MITSKLHENFMNKSECIREIYRRFPLYSNKEIKRDVKEIYKVDVDSNLICAVIGKYKYRKNKAAAKSNYIKEMVEFIKRVGSDSYATYCLLEAKKLCGK